MESLNCLFHGPKWLSETPYKQQMPLKKTANSQKEAASEPSNHQCSGATVDGSEIPFPTTWHA